MKMITTLMFVLMLFGLAFAVGPGDSELTSEIVECPFIIQDGTFLASCDYDITGVPDLLCGMLYHR